MSAVADRLRGATRWSLTSRCPRMGYYAYEGVEPVPPDELTLKRWERGRRDEEDVIRALRKKHGRKNVRLQKAVPWPDEGLPLGELHQDAFLVKERVPVEVKSHLSGGASNHDLIQLAGEVYYDTEAGDTGVLIVVDRDLNERVITVTLDEKLVEIVRGRATALAEAIANDEPPARICGKPSDGQSLMCPFISHCFEGWEPPALPRVQTEEIVTLARQLYEVSLIKRGLAGTKVDVVPVAEALGAQDIDLAIATLRDIRTVKGVEYLEKEIKAQLTTAIGRAPEDFLKDPGEYAVGPLVLKRNQVDRTGFTVAPTTYETLTVKRVSDEALLEPEDYGEVPF
jgi:hypothetical protein